MLEAIHLRGFKCFPPAPHRTRVPLAPLTYILGPNSSGKSSIMQALMAVSQSWGQPASIQTLETVGHLVDLGRFQNVIYRSTDRASNSEQTGPGDDTNHGAVSIGFEFDKMLATDASDESELTLMQAKTVGCEFTWKANKEDQLSRHISQGELDQIELWVSLSNEGRGVCLPLSRETLDRDKAQPGTIQFTLKFDAIRDWLEQCPEDEVAHLLHDHADVFQVHIQIHEGAWRGSETEAPNGMQLKKRKQQETPGDSQIAHLAVSQEDSKLQDDELQALDALLDALVEVTPFDGAANAWAESPDKEELKPRGASLLQTLSDGMNIIFTRLRLKLLQLAHVGGLRVRGQRLYDLAPGTSNGRVGADGSRMVDVLSEEPDVVAETNRMLNEAIGMDYQIELRPVSTNAACVELILTSAHERLDPPACGTSLPDLGSGISQVVPVLAQLASARVGAMGVGTQTVLLEQPELHLHPKWTSQLADVLLDAALTWNAPDGVRADPTQVIAETHSPELVLATGAAISGAIDVARTGVTGPHIDGPIETFRSGVTCITIEAARNPGEAPRVTNVGFDTSGTFSERWPGGFFPERDRIVMGRDVSQSAW